MALSGLVTLKVSQMQEVSKVGTVLGITIQNAKLNNFCFYLTSKISYYSYCTVSVCLLCKS
jgi:hypothetical protein